MKKVILLCVILFITGCDVEYNIHFNETTIRETITLNIENNNENKEIINYLNETPFYAIINQYTKKEYNKEITENNNYKKYNFSYEYKNKENFATRFNNCYDAYSITENNNIVSFNTSKEFKCMVYDYNPIQNLIINITSEYVVTEHNADEVVNGVYKWHINDNNKENKPIKFSFDKAKEKNKLQKFLNKNKTTIIVVLSLLAISLLTVLGIFIRCKQINKI